MKVAFATTDGKKVDEHFGRAGMFVIYEVTPQEYKLVETRRFAEGRDRAIEETRDMGQVHENLVEAKVDKLADCKIIYITEIGGPSAARLARRGIMPVKVKKVIDIEEAIEELFNTLKTSPPPWLKKALQE
ncbi:MAG: nitrogen fixation protein NifX [Nitrospirae bacterium]|nr:nitrogen fixation protein NifX [Nitrospirota bacterium]